MLIEFKSQAGAEIYVDPSKLVAAYELEPGYTILVFNGHQQGVQGTIRDVVAKLSPAPLKLFVAPSEGEKTV